MLLDRVREACAAVAARSAAVRITGDPVRYARELLAEGEAEAAVWDRETHFSGGEEETAAFVFTLDAVNFGSGYFPHLQKRAGSSGYFTVALALKERFERHGPLSALELRRLLPEDVGRLFGQEPGDPVRSELMLHFTRALNDLGEFLEQRFQGSFGRLLRAADGSAERLAQLLIGMPYFHDVTNYQGREVPILKRAQITPSDLALALAGFPSGEFHDLDRLTIFADNLVPHVLRCDGLLEYSPSLAQRLDRGELLTAGSPEEVEIRATALHAVELMVDGLRLEGTRLNARTLDLRLWNRGQASIYRGGSKHRTRTVFY